MHGSSMHALSSKLDSIIITPQILQTNVLSYKLHLLVLNNITNYTYWYLTILLQTFSTVK